MLNFSYFTFVLAWILLFWKKQKQLLFHLKSWKNKMQYMSEIKLVKKLSLKDVVRQKQSKKENQKELRKDTVDLAVKEDYLTLICQ